jgi:phospholipase/carboxylesterase
MPRIGNQQLLRLKTERELRVFVGHGTYNPVVPVAAARRAARLLGSAGAEVRFQAYASTHRTHPDMLRDVNRWIMDAVSDIDGLAPPGV